MAVSFRISTTIPAPPERIFAAWLDSNAHSAMTGAGASVSPNPGEVFQAWDGYIQGRNLELEPGRRIVQAWRTVEFADDEPDSRLEITFQAVPDGTLVTIFHSELPPNGMQYEQGWQESYFDPMLVYFEG